MVKRIYVEKRSGFDVPAKQLLEDFKYTLDIKIDGLRTSNKFLPIKIRQINLATKNFLI
ncbi:MAG: hypothetical protein IJG32_06035 [Selenomonadaceae bacterium]|nr:hypothetical protein [Selenomonadaceae bacterium]